MYNSGNKLLNKVTEIYIFLIIVLFPLIVDKTGFFNILECKWRSFISISLIYILAIMAIIIFYLLRYKTNLLKKKTSIGIIIGFIFLVINVLSCILSPYFSEYNLYIGTGRGEGLIVSSLYIISFILVSYFGEFNKKYILYFGISSVLVSFIAVLQYIGFNPFNMYQDGIGTHNVSFMATIGNVDFISAYYTITLAISFMALILLDNNKYEKIIYYLAIFLGIFIFQIIDVNSGKVAFLGLFLIMLPIFFKNNYRVASLLKVVAIILLSTGINMFINVEYHYDLGRLGFYYRLDYLVLLYLIFSIILYCLAIYLNKLKYEIKIRNYYKNYYKFGILLVFIGLLGLYIIPFKSGMLYEMHELLHLNFDDNFGTYRIFLWKRTLPLIKYYPLIGTGPDTFALRFMPKYSEDIAAIGPLTINDTAANVYLTMLVNLGILGTLVYILLLGNCVYSGIKNYNKYSIVLLSGIICYMISSFFNLSVVIISPLFWILLGVHHICIFNNS